MGLTKEIQICIHREINLAKYYYYHKAVSYVCEAENQCVVLGVASETGLYIQARSTQFYKSTMIPNFT